MTDLHPSPEIARGSHSTADARGRGEEPDARRFRASTYDEAVAAAADVLGQKIRVLGANRIRRGGLGGFFATDLGIEISAVADETAPPLNSDETPTTADRSPLAGIDWPRDTVHLSNPDAGFVHDVLELGEEGMENLLTEISRHSDVHADNTDQRIPVPHPFEEHLINEGFDFADVVDELDADPTNPPGDRFAAADDDIGPARIPEHLPSSWIAPAILGRAIDTTDRDDTQRRRAEQMQQAERDRAAHDAATAAAAKLEEAEREQAARDAVTAADEAERVFAEREHARREERAQQRRDDAAKAAERTAAKLDAARADAERARQSIAAAASDTPLAERPDSVLAELDEMLRRVGVDISQPTQVRPATISPTLEKLSANDPVAADPVAADRENSLLDPLRRPTELASEATDRLVSRLADVVAADGSCLKDLSRVRVAVTTPDGLIIEMTAEMGDRDV